MEQRLSSQLFAILRLFVEERTGLHYRTEDADVFSEKLGARMREAGFESALDYYYLLRYDDPSGEELARLVDVLVVGETYFFRELDAVRGAIAHVIQPAIAERGLARVWCAACATGEEPLSFAMLLAREGILDRCRILATDVSRRSLSRAREGRYGARSLRAIRNDATLESLAGRFMALRSDTTNVSPDLLRAIEYREDNLLEPGPPGELGSFDLVMCRNVFIYFSDDTVLRVVGRLGDALRPGGRLLVGASESLLRLGTRLRCEERGGTFFYTKERS
jgi:chemotaxis protein methyltransferase CheR